MKNGRLVDTMVCFCGKPLPPVSRTEHGHMTRGHDNCFLSLFSITLMLFVLQGKTLPSLTTIFFVTMVISPAPNNTCDIRAADTYTVFIYYLTHNKRRTLSMCPCDCMLVDANVLRQYNKQFYSVCTHCILSLKLQVHWSQGKKKADSSSQESCKHDFRRKMAHNFRESLSLSLLTSEGFIQLG